MGMVQNTNMDIDNSEYDMNMEYMNMDNTIDISIEQIISICKFLLGTIQDVDVRKTLNRTLTDAVNTRNFEKIKKTFAVIGHYLNNQTKPKCDIKKKKKYDYIPTFIEAGLDFIYDLCEDLKNMPNLTEYYASAEKGEFPDTTGWAKEKENKNKRKAKTVDTFVKKDMVLVKGDTQSGKEKFTIASCIKSILEGRVALFITRRNTCDADKAERAVLRNSNSFSEYMKKHSVEEEFKIGCFRVEGDNLKNIKTIIPGIIIALGNECQLFKLLEFAKRFPHKFDIYIDEIDNVDYGEDSQASNILKELKKLSHQTIGITATPLDSILSEEELKSVNIMRLSKPDDYRGFIDIVVKLLVEDENTSAVNKKITNYAEIIESDKNLEPFLNRFSRSKPDFAWSIKKYLPNICLIKNSRINENQETMFNGIVANYLNDFAVVLQNGNGIKISYPNMPAEIMYNKKNIKPNKYIDMDITEALQFLKDNGGVQLFPRIIVIAGELAGRCISYVSRDFEWHLTDMYYNPAKSTPIPEMIQSCGRLCGRNKGKSHLYLHCTKLVADALYDGFHFTNEIVDRAIASPLLAEDTEMSFSKSVKAVPMNKQKFPKGRHMTSKVVVKRKDFNLVKKDDNGHSLDKYKYTEEAEVEVQVGDIVKEDIDISESLKEVGEEEYKRLISMFSKWSNGTSKIAMFMQKLDPVKVYTNKEMKDLCDETGIIKLGQLLNIKVGTNGYGTILRKKENTYRLQPCLVKEFNKYF